MKILIALVTMVLGVLVLAKFYGINPDELTPEIISDLFQRSLTDLWSMISRLPDQIKEAVERIGAGK
jgi:hypothetical protein